MWQALIGLPNVHKIVAGRFECAGDGAQGDIAVALFRYKDDRPLLALCQGEPAEIDNWHLTFYTMGRNGRMEEVPHAIFPQADDPKQLVPLNAALDEAAAMRARGETPQAIAVLRDVLRRRPDFTVAYDRLAFMLRSSGHLADAIAVADEAARAGRADRTLLRTLGSMYTEAGDMRRAAHQAARRRAARAAPRVSLVVTSLIVPGTMILIIASIVLGSGLTKSGIFQ